MDNLTKLKAIKRWQSDVNLKKFKCQNNESHEILEPSIIKNEILMKCPTCGRTFKCLNERVFELAHILLLKDKRKRRN